MMPQSGEGRAVLCTRGPRFCGHKSKPPEIDVVFQVCACHLTTSWARLICPCLPRLPFLFTELLLSTFLPCLALECAPSGNVNACTDLGPFLRRSRVGPSSRMRSGVRRTCWQRTYVRLDIRHHVRPIDGDNLQQTQTRQVLSERTPTFQSRFIALP